MQRLTLAILLCTACSGASGTTTNSDSSPTSPLATTQPLSITNATYQKDLSITAPDTGWHIAFALTNASSHPFSLTRVTLDAGSYHAAGDVLRECVTDDAVTGIEVTGEVPWLSTVSNGAAVVKMMAYGSPAGSIGNVLYIEGVGAKQPAELKVDMKNLGASPDRDYAGPLVLTLEGIDPATAAPLRIEAQVAPR